MTLVAPCTRDVYGTASTPAAGGMTIVQRQLVQRGKRRVPESESRRDTL